MAIRYWQVDAFAERPFEGNPAAVLQLDAWPPDELMQAIALEMNLSETAFLVKQGPNHYGLRWFTPATEVDLCGHATLASAHVLFSSGTVPYGTLARFETRSGMLQVRCDREGMLQMDFPSEPATSVPVPEGLASALGADVVAYGQNRWDGLAELTDAASVRALKPDLGWVGRLPLRGLIVTAAEVEGAKDDFVSRFFGPQSGVPEDPVTGSAHCALAPYWAKRLGRNTLSGWQASPRGGRVGVSLMGDRVELTGHAVTVAEGTLAISL